MDESCIGYLRCSHSTHLYLHCSGALHHRIALHPPSCWLLDSLHSAVVCLWPTRINATPHHKTPISFLNLCGLHTLPQRWLPVPHRQGGHPSLSSSCSSSSSTSPPSSPHQLLQPHHHNRYGSLPPSLSLSPPPSRLCGDWGLVGWQHVVPTFFPSIV